MAIGDLINDVDYTLEFNGLLLGGDSNYNLIKIEGLLDLPSIRSADKDKLRRHGQYAGDDFLDARTITVTFDLYAATQDDLSSLISELELALAPCSDEQPLVFHIPGVAGGNTARANARCRRKALPVTMEYRYGLPQAIVEFHATDPRLYLNDLQTKQIGLAANASGLTFDATPSFVFGDAASGGYMTVTNQGSFATSPTFRIYGPIENPRIENVTSEKTFALDIEIVDGNYIDIDFENRSILENGVASRYSSMTVSSEWFSLEPGDTEIRFTADAYTDASLAILYRSAWL